MTASARRPGLYPVVAVDGDPVDIFVSRIQDRNGVEPS